jgi:type IV pilus assembly protein PilW
MKTRQQGHTLMEMMVALGLDALVVSASLLAYHSQRATYAAAADSLRIDEAGGMALDVLTWHLRMAGFAPLGTPRPEGLFACLRARPVGRSTPVCESLASGSDGVLVRYVGDRASTWPTAQGLASDCLGQAIGVEQGLVVNRFYARSSPSTGQPELHCEGSGRAGIGQALVEGVERLWLRYWLHGAWLDATQVDAWAQVGAVEICVQVRGWLPGKAGRRFDDCDGHTVPVADGRMRRVYRRIIALRNQLVS